MQSKTFFVTEYEGQFVTANRWEDLPQFCGPRIAPGLRWKRMVDREEAANEAKTRERLLRWVENRNRNLRAHP